MVISRVFLGSRRPQLGRTQYFLGAVVLILNKIECSVGLVNRMNDETAVQNGPTNLSSFAGSMISNCAGLLDIFAASSAAYCRRDQNLTCNSPLDSTRDSRTKHTHKKKTRTFHKFNFQLSQRQFQLLMLPPPPARKTHTGNTSCRSMDPSRR